MSEVFLAFDDEDAARAQRLGAGLQARGFAVWWELGFAPARARPGLMRAVVDQSAATIVIWSPRAAVSDTVVDIAGHAAAQGKLCAVRFEPVREPPAFAGWSANDLSDWDQGGPLNEGFEALIAQVEARAVGFLPQGDAERRARARTFEEDMRDLMRALRKGGDGGWRAYLERQPAGVFAPVANEQLRAPPAYVSPADLAEADDGANNHWRYGAPGWPERARAGLAHPVTRVVLAGGGLLALGALGVVGLGRIIDTNRSPSAPVEVAQSAPPRSAPIEPASPAIAPLSEAAPPVERQATQAPARVAAATISAAPTPLHAQSGADMAPSPPLVANPAPPELASAASARAMPTLTGAPYDLASVERDTRGAVEAARHAERQAIAAAERNRGAGGAFEPVSSRGWSYVGQRVDGAPQGRGAALWDSGARYAGEWRAARPQGWGVLVYPGGERYEGEFAAGRPTGRGVLWAANGARIVGAAQFNMLIRRPS